MSNVINGKYHLLAPATRRRVEQAIQQLNYRPHTSARNLRRAERLSVGMILVDESPSFLMHPGHNHVIAGLSNFLSERGYSLAIQGVKPEQVGGSLFIKNVATDALCAVLCGTASERNRCIEALCSTGQPVVLFHEFPAPVRHDLCVIREDDVGGGFLLAQHVIAKGCRHLVMLRPDLVWSSMEGRECGMRRALLDAGVPHELHVVTCGDAGVLDTQSALSEFVAKHGLPDAILGGNDQLGIAAMKFFRSRGIAVPEQVKSKKTVPPSDA